MAKVQFNCRLEQKTVDAINECAVRYAEAFKRKVSQAEVIERTFDGQQLPATVHSAPRKLSKKAQAVEALASSDLTAQVVGRDDIEYGSHTELPQGQHVATLDAVGPPISGGQGKASTETWRKGRAPLLKPKERK